MCAEIDSGVARQVHTMAMIRRKFGGLEAQKFQFDIVIGEMRGPSKLAGQELNVCWTRGAKIASTAHVKCSEAGAATWNETLSLICTMYRSSNGKYQEKNAKLAVREKKKKKTVGKVHFDLGEYVSMQGSKQVTMPLEVSTGVFSANESSGALELTVNCRFIPPGDAGEYSEMTAMDASEMSTQSVDSLDEDAEAPVAVSAPKAMNASMAASMGGASFADGLMEPPAAPHELVDKNKALTEEMEQLKKQLKKANDEAEDSAAEVKRLQKSNYALQDTLARQQNEGDEALCARIAELEKQHEEEAAAKSTLERQVSDLNDQLEQAVSAAAAAAAQGASGDDEQTAQLITSLVEAKIAYANSEEEKGNMGLKLVQLRRALAKERELNQQVSQRMTRLEVKAEALKQGQPTSPKNSTKK
jgi:hypothetical protein